MKGISYFDMFSPSSNLTSVVPQISSGSAVTQDKAVAEDEGMDYVNEPVRSSWSPEGACVAFD